MKIPYGNLPFGAEFIQRMCELVATTGFPDDMTDSKYQILYVDGILILPWVTEAGYLTLGYLTAQIVKRQD
ncbi:hypothetical protein SISNIDRAFT_453209 [Sistotremastrum niveocremeum HHB9708]|uniref:Uncharacterized protein n=1 Tax=Sistotremastrum niveocremeum HHB9708 TaxID=1314777 RepID=A0A164VP36_9AGAM|nr:hypothetical protein SISNIDRAFT_453209 [Sistotremastrum niveocremeum HHB9708]